MQAPAAGERAKVDRWAFIYGVGRPMQKRCFEVRK